MSEIDIGRLWLDRAYQYAEDVRSGKQIACKYVKLAVDRWFYDLQTGPMRGFYFSELHAARYFRFVHRYCRHYKGKKAGKQIELEPWQCFADANLFGWIREDGTRRFRTAYEEVARKNGKSTRIAAAGLFYLLGDGEGGPEVYSAATKKEQAREIFDCSRAMVRKSSVLSQLCDAQEHKIIAGDGKYLPLSRDSKSMDGFNVHAALIDELHAHKDSGIWDVLRSAVGARTQSIIRAITTAGFDKNSFCFQRRKYAIQVLEGSVTDDSHFALIFTLDDPKDWDKPEEWVKANPNLGVSVDFTDLQLQCNEAKHLPTAKTEFLTKRLNIWVYGLVGWMPMLEWHKGKKDFNSLDLWQPAELVATDLDGAECYGGLDLSSVEDMCSLSLNFPIGNTRRIIQRAYLPEAALVRRLAKGDKTLEQFKDSGHLVVLPGAVVDYEWIKKDILNICARFDVKGIAYDRWNSSQLVNDLLDKGVPMIKFGQGFGSMSAPSKELLRLVLAELIEHNDPLLTWAMSNVVVDKNPAGDIKPDKSKVAEKIDPAVATIMAIGISMGIEDEEEDKDAAVSAHLEKHGIRTL